jgi:hypothetical protein
MSSTIVPRDVPKHLLVNRPIGNFDTLSSPTRNPGIERPESTIVNLIISSCRKTGTKASPARTLGTFLYGLGKSLRQLSPCGRTFLSNPDQTRFNPDINLPFEITSHDLCAILMRTGRPAFHIRACWISVDLPTGSCFYELDQHGRLQRHNGQIRPHHSKPAAPPARPLSRRAPDRPQSPPVLAHPPPIEPILSDPPDAAFEFDWLGGPIEAPPLDMMGDFELQAWDIFLR